MSNKAKQQILVVDDEPNIRIVLRTTLETAGYLIEEAPDGAAALERLEAGGIDLIVLDLNMPVLGGMSVLERLHVRPQPKPSTVVLTAHGSIPAAVKAVRLGTSDFLLKPVLPNDFLLSVASVLAESPTLPATPDAHLLNVSQVLHDVRRDIFNKDLKHADQLMHQIAEKAATDPAYYNLLGVIHEAEGDRRAVITFYRKAGTIDGGYQPARDNLRRLQELEMYGETKRDVVLGDEANLLKGMGGAVGRHNLDLVRRIMEK